MVSVVFSSFSSSLMARMVFSYSSYCCSVKASPLHRGEKVTFHNISWVEISSKHSMLFNDKTLSFYIIHGSALRLLLLVNRTFMAEVGCIDL